MADWKDYSDVEVNFTDRGDVSWKECDIEVKQTNVPASFGQELFIVGWNENIFKKIETMIGIPIFKQE